MLTFTPHHQKGKASTFAFKRTEIPQNYLDNLIILCKVETEICTSHKILHRITMFLKLSVNLMKRRSSAHIRCLNTQPFMDADFVSTYH